MLKNKKGFTLIELLIVIVIIGILSAFFINTSVSNLKKGRDAKRKTDLETVRSGIETFRADCNSYPTTISFGGSLVGNGATPNCPNTNTYITSIPQDPTTGQSYLYWSDGTTYQICASLETGSGSVSCGSSTTCGSGTCNYQVTP